MVELQTVPWCDGESEGRQGFSVGGLVHMLAVDVGEMRRDQICPPAAALIVGSRLPQLYDLLVPGLPGQVERGLLSGPVAAVHCAL